MSIVVDHSWEPATTQRLTGLLLPQSPVIVISIGTLLWNNDIMNQRFPNRSSRIAGLYENDKSPGGGKSITGRDQYPCLIPLLPITKLFHVVSLLICCDIPR